MNKNNYSCGGALFEAQSGKDCVSSLRKTLSAYFGKDTVPVCSLDGALHTALYLCGVLAGDYVFVPTYTFYSYIQAVDNIGAVPVFLDCDMTRCVSPEALDAALLWAQLQNKLPKAVVIDNAFGASANLNLLVPMCKAYSVPTVELCGTLGGKYSGKNCGSCADYGAVGLPSGGAIVCGDDKEKAEEFCRYAYTDGLNFDYRLNNYAAAVDCATIDEQKKSASRGNANLSALMAKCDCAVSPFGDSGRFACVRTDRAGELTAAGFEVKKPPPVHTLDKYREANYFEHERGYSVSQTLSKNALIGMDFPFYKRAKLLHIINS